MSKINGHLNMILSIPSFLIPTTSLKKRELLVFLTIASSLEKNKTAKHQILFSDFGFFDKGKNLSKVIDEILAKLQVLEISFKGIVFKPFNRLAKAGKTIEIEWSEASMMAITDGHQFLQVDADHLFKLKIVSAILMHLLFLKTDYAIATKRTSLNVGHDKIIPLSIGKDNLRKAIGLQSDRYASNGILKQKLVRSIKLVNEVRDNPVSILKVKQDKIKYLIAEKPAVMLKSKAIRYVDKATQCEIKELQRFKDLNSPIDLTQLSFDCNTDGKQGLILNALEHLQTEKSADLGEAWSNWNYLTKEIKPQFAQSELLTILQKCTYKYSIERFIEVINACKKAKADKPKFWIIKALNSPEWVFNNDSIIIKNNEVIMSKDSKETKEIYAGYNDTTQVRNVIINEAIRNKMKNDIDLKKSTLTEEQKLVLEEKSREIISLSVRKDLQQYSKTINNFEEFCETSVQNAISKAKEHNILLNFALEKDWKHETNFDDKGLVSFITNASGEVVFEAKNI